MDLGNAMLARAAEVQPRFNDRTLHIDVVNNTGHKLPTGYAEGRRMWLQVTLLDNSQVVSQLGNFDDEGKIIAPLKVYEIKQGLTESHAEAIGRPELAGEGFHFVLNNAVFKDNRIPPRGWTNVQYAARSMEPVGASYADGVYTDTTTLQLPPGVDEVQVQLWYQSASGEYLDFLESEADDLVPDGVLGSEVNWGQVVGMLRDQCDLDQPVLMRSAGVAVPDLALQKSVAPTGDLLPGQPITFTLTFSNPALVSVHNVRIADVLPSALAFPAVEDELAPFVRLIDEGTPPNLAWRVDGLFDSTVPNKIHVRGLVDPTLNVDTMLDHRAVMSGNVGANVMVRVAQAQANVVVPRVQLAAAAYSVAEDAGAVEVTVTMDRVNPYAVTKFYLSTQEGTARAGSDFVALEDFEVTLLAGASSGTFTVQLVNDDVAENDEFFTILLTDASGAALGAGQSATVTIENDDAGTVIPNEAIFLPLTER
jgi:uncharacterized repeat protein (TIGR01451 family)